jgi:hypothetical protein
LKICGLTALIILATVLGLCACSGPEIITQYSVRMGPIKSLNCLIDNISNNYIHGFILSRLKVMRMGWFIHLP